MRRDGHGTRPLLDKSVQIKLSCSRAVNHTKCRNRHFVCRCNPTFHQSIVTGISPSLCARYERTKSIRGPWAQYKSRYLDTNLCVPTSCDRTLVKSWIMCSKPLRIASSKGMWVVRIHGLCFHKNCFIAAARARGERDRSPEERDV